MDLNILVIFDENPKGFLADGIANKIEAKLKGIIANRVTVCTDDPKYKYIPGVKVPVILRDVIMENVKEKDIEKALSGLLAGYKEYSNLRVKIIEN